MLFILSLYGVSGNELLKNFGNGVDVRGCRWGYVSWLFGVKILGFVELVM